MNRLLPPYCVPQHRRPSKASLVPKIRQAVDQWRAEGYPGITKTTGRLLQYWFQQDHRVKKGKRGQEFGYFFCQREAIETLIYIYEVRQLRSLYDLARNYPPERPFLIQPGEDLFARYVDTFRQARFDQDARREIENQIAVSLALSPGSVISHFSRRKHFQGNLSELSQGSLFDDHRGLVPLRRVNDVLRRSKLSGDFFDVFVLPKD